MLDEALTFLQARSLSFEILLVDDCSQDRTAALALEYQLRMQAEKGNRIRVIRLLKNQGKGFAVKVGMLSASGRHRLMVDADGATKFSDLALLEEGLGGSDGGYDVAFGSRRHLAEGAKAKRTWYALRYSSFHLARKRVLVKNFLFS